MRTEFVPLPDGDDLELRWIDSNQYSEQSSVQSSNPLVIILHGLEGSINSAYARGLMQSLSQQGFSVVFMHFRGCGKNQTRLPRFYHSGDTDDLRYLINLLKEREPTTALMAVGFSLGGNVLLKYLGETSEQTPLVCAVSVSVPFVLQQTVQRLQKGFSRIYQHRLLQSLTKKIQLMNARMTLPIAIEATRPFKSLYDFDERITAPLHGFKNAKDYYERSSSRQFLQFIKKPTLIIHSADDPFMTVDVLPSAQELSVHIQWELTPQGGHVGFVSGAIPGRARYWLDERIPLFLQQQIKV